MREDFLRGLNIEYFHASEDKQPVRDSAFEIIVSNLPSLSIDSIIVEKAKTNPALREMIHFYPKIMGYLIGYLIKQRNLNDYSGVVVITDSLPVSRQRKSVEKAIQLALSSIMKSIGKPYYIFHHDSKSSGGLQVADYCNWAIYRKWERQDLRSYNLIGNAIKSEFDIFAAGSKRYY